MNIEKKKAINWYIENNKDDETFSLVLEKLSDFLSSFLQQQIQIYNNARDFRPNLIGDYYLSSNFGNKNFLPYRGLCGNK